ncbi:Ig-like domain-containing protein, partial [Chishuiella sp.]|uniref:Ig-like domain-containing protein n=1 Tax=Chishuiella sp. TaxID=1969467 RepID=UPI0028AB91CC
MDKTPPTASIVIANNAMSIGVSSSVTITFSEAVTGLTLANLTAQNGELTSLVQISSKIWLATFTPNNNVEDGINVIALDFDKAKVADLAGNVGIGTIFSNNYSIDTKAPTTPLSFIASAKDKMVELNWSANTEKDLKEYVISVSSAKFPKTVIYRGSVTVFSHSSLINGVQYTYTIKAVDNMGNESTEAILFATPMGTQNITFSPLTAMMYGDTAKPLSAISSSGLKVTYTSSDPTIAEVNEVNLVWIVTPKTAGEVTITASQTGNNEYTSATDITQLLTITKASLTVAADAQLKVYGTNDPSLTYKITSGQLI